MMSDHLESSDFLFQRDAGLLLHPSSLPGKYGIGDFGPDTARWIDLLAEAGQSLWQTLPLGPAGYGDSPYQAISAFASNPAFLSPEWMQQEELISTEELNSFELPCRSEVDYTAVYAHKTRLIQLVAPRFFQLDASHPLQQAYLEFITAQSPWLEDYALFFVLKESFDKIPWHQWPEGLRDRDPEQLTRARHQFQTEIDLIRVEQFFLEYQWQQLRQRANRQGIRIVGDLPIFVAHDSADVWCHKELFQLNADGSPAVVAGVPPDYFSTTGQLWGNPLYAWDQHQADNFQWWHRRLRRLLEGSDLARIDHFRGFVACWEIPGDAETAMDGRWVEAPGVEFFQSLENQWGRPLPFIAEDLGVITEEVVALRDQFSMPGIRLMQFAFGNDPMGNTFIPEAFIQNSAAYTGTHDNDTVQGWFNSVAGAGSVRTAEEIETERQNAMNYFKSDGSEIHLDFIRALYRSDAGAAIVPLQDLLGLDSSARMNRPGEASGSWRWRLTSMDDTEKALQELKTLTLESSRGTTAPVASISC